MEVKTMSIRPVDVHMTITRSQEINQNNNNQAQRFQDSQFQQMLTTRRETEQNTKTVTNSKRTDQNRVKNDEKERERNRKQKGKQGDKDNNSDESMALVDISV
jgi:hypothetical protein